MKPISRACHVSLIPQDDRTHALRFELYNRGNAPIELSTYEPFTAFTVAATVGGQRATVHQPALDIPVNPVILTVPARGALTVQTPIQLRIARDADPGDDGFIWTITHPADAVTLEVTLDLPAPFDEPCDVSVASHHTES